MTSRMHVYGIDRPQFERLLGQPLREHLLAFVDGRQELVPKPVHRKGRSRSSVTFGWLPSFLTDDSISITIRRGFKVQRHFKGECRILSREEIDAMPELAVTTRDHIQSGGPVDFHSLMDLFADFAPYCGVRTLIDGYRQSILGHLLDSFAYRYGPESSDMQAVEELFDRFRGFGMEGVAGRGFPPLPRCGLDVVAVNGWTTDETRLAILSLRILMDYGGESPHREDCYTSIGHKRLMLHDELSEPTPEEHQLWELWSEIINRFFTLEEYTEPAVICFANIG